MGVARQREIASRFIKWQKQVPGFSWQAAVLCATDAHSLDRLELRACKGDAVLARPRSRRARRTASSSRTHTSLSCWDTPWSDWPGSPSCCRRTRPSCGARPRWAAACGSAFLQSAGPGAQAPHQQCVSLAQMAYLQWIRHLPPWNCTAQNTAAGCCVLLNRMGIRLVALLTYFSLFWACSALLLCKRVSQAHTVETIGVLGYSTGNFEETEADAVTASGILHMARMRNRVYTVEMLAVRACAAASD